MKRKQGVSLIVLVITIIVMIILAASVVITLSNTGIINRASLVVDLANQSQVQNLASLIWADAYTNNLRGQVLIDEVIDKLEEQGIKEDEWNIIVSDKGVNVTTFSGLGDLIESAEDYGKTVDYVANGITKWKLFYHTNEYVYLIASEALSYGKVPEKFKEKSCATTLSTDITLPDGSKGTVERIHWKYGTELTEFATIQNSSLWLANWKDYSLTRMSKYVAYFFDETLWDAYKNTEKYGDYVVGAIGTPSAEMFVASWNAKREATKKYEIYADELVLSEYKEKGYYINNTVTIDISTEDDLYIWCADANSDIWLAAPSSADGYIMYVENYGKITANDTTNYYRCVRPVICLKADIPAKIGTTTDFSIIK
ncbi:MAG: type II secretion system protein [Clostridia bacterium]|nr:type II secretion system protein [Clostridia bacterium]